MEFFEIYKKMTKTLQAIAFVAILGFFVSSFLLKQKLTKLRTRNHEIMRQINEIQDKHLSKA